mmetsp:Transcript_72908/g.152215  ORF Transcript_72908/g.152215 Transcript_72908/m.152215 type:complete len:215 (-) Transcript_72908:79-723(-)
MKENLVVSDDANVFDGGVVPTLVQVVKGHGQLGQCDELLCLGVPKLKVYVDRLSRRKGDPSELAVHAVEVRVGAGRELLVGGHHDLDLSQIVVLVHVLREPNDVLLALVWAMASQVAVQDPLQLVGVAAVLVVLLPVLLHRLQQLHALLSAGLQWVGASNFRALGCHCENPCGRQGGSNKRRGYPASTKKRGGGGWPVRGGGVEGEELLCLFCQ